MDCRSPDIAATIISIGAFRAFISEQDPHPNDKLNCQLSKSARQLIHAGPMRPRASTCPTAGMRADALLMVGCGNNSSGGGGTGGAAPGQGGSGPASGSAGAANRAGGAAGRQAGTGGEVGTGGAV